MTQEYRLVFSGEVVEGQHPAIVKKRLSVILKLDDKRMDLLFSGQSVVVKKATDEKTAARYQTAFQKAGAKLRLLPADGVGGDVLSAQAADQTESAEGQETHANGQSELQVVGGMQVLPVGADMLREDERQTVDVPEIATEHLSVQGSVFVIDEPERPVSVPAIDHITLAELGVVLREGQAHESVDIAIPDPNFEIAEVGADMDETEKAPPPPPPDVSHIALADDDTRIG
jgi:hypothetical protein